MFQQVQLVGMDKFRSDLAKYRKGAIPYAARNGLNACAFAMMREWRREVKSTFTLRNQFTERSIRVERATGLDMRRMVAITGSVAPYMGDQESGATIRGKGKHKAIPAPAAAGNAPGGSKLTRTVRPANKLSAISVKTPSMARYGKRRQNAIVIAVALRKGQKHVLLNRSKGTGRGIFEVRTVGKNAKAKVRLLWGLGKTSVHVDAQPTMKRTLERSDQTFQGLLNGAYLAQLKRFRVLGY